MVWKIEDSDIDSLVHFIPSQGPLKDFIHHNTLHAFQSEPFDQGVLRAARLYGARARLQPGDYQRFNDQGVLSSEVVLSLGLESLPQLEAQVSLGWVREGIRLPGFQNYGVDILRVIRSPLFRVLAHFLDQGVAAHSEQEVHHFWSWMKQYFQGRCFNFDLLSDPFVQGAFNQPPRSVIEEALPLLVKEPAYFKRYLLEVLLGHPGWSGLVHQVEVRPEGLFEQRKILTEELLALELAMDVAVARGIPGFKPFSGAGKCKEVSEISIDEKPAEIQLRLANEALEWSCYKRKIEKIERVATHPISSRGSVIQVYFCIDDRECSIRRHIEKQDENITTYGAAGFFGLDCKVLEAGHPYMVQSCPVNIQPNVCIVEEFIEDSNDWFDRKFPKTHHHYLSRTYTHPLKGWFHSIWQGFLMARHLFLQVFSPKDESLERPTRLLVLYHGEKNGIRLGYTREEMADRVFSVLRNTGFQPRNSKLVLMMAHEASSNNNPHYAAYDCGACSGRSGALNARAFALMANDPEVRVLVKAKGIEIPEDCHFIGGVHNTTRDEVRYFDLQDLPQTYQDLFNDFSLKFENALDLNAKERSHKFELFDQKASIKKAHEHVRLRSAALFEPRPELNHSTNALCVVGRRQLTSGASLNRRSFLHSYDPSIDPEGVILSGILNAVVPVCGGINLEYYFSRLDNEVYGAGTKLPHNVVGLFGVSNGALGDLKTGLPLQMIEVHDPLRLLIIVEQTLDVALKAIERNEATFEWVKNEWVHYSCFNVLDKKVYRWFRGCWEKVNL